MRVHVTGAYGFIGRHFINELKQRDHEVSHSGKEHAFAPYLALEFGVPEVVVHLGAVGKHKAEELTTYYNVGSTATWARYCSSIGSEFLYVTTYEDPHTSFYALTKEMGRQAAAFYDAERTVVLGPVYGSGGKSAVNVFLRAAREGEQIHVAEGAYRSFMHVSDTVWALAQLTEDTSWLGKAHISRTDDRYSMLGVARLACELVGQPEDLIKTVPLEDGHMLDPITEPWTWTNHKLISLRDGMALAG